MTDQATLPLTMPRPTTAGVQLAEITGPEVNVALFDVACLRQEFGMYAVARLTRNATTRGGRADPRSEADCQAYEEMFRKRLDRIEAALRSHKPGETGDGPAHDHSVRLDGAGCPACGYVTRMVPAGTDRHA